MPSRPARSSFSIFIASMTTIGCRARTASPLLTSTRTTLPGIGASEPLGAGAGVPALLFSAGTAAAVERDRHHGRPDVNGQLARRGVPRHGHLVAESAAKPGHSTRIIRGPANAGHYAGAGSVRLQADLRTLRNQQRQRMIRDTHGVDGPQPSVQFDHELSVLAPDDDLPGAAADLDRRTAFSAALRPAPATSTGARPASRSPFGRIDADSAASSGCSAAAIAATSSAAGVGGANGRPFRSASTSSRYVVWNRPETNSGWSSSQVKNGIVVLMPATTYSPSARRMRAIAAGRSSAHATSFEIIGS